MVASKSYSTRFRRGIRKVARTAGRALKKRYVSPRGGLKMSRIAKDVAIMKTMINSEKEMYNQNISGDVSPTSPYGPVAIANIPEGTAHGQRDGDSVKLHAYQWDIRALSQTSAVAPRYIHVYLVKYIGPRGTAPAISTFFRTDMDGNYSTYSKREPDHYTSYQVICRKNIYIPADTVSGVQMYRQVKLYGRFKGKTHQRYNGTAATALITDQMYVIAVSSDGTIGTSTATTIQSQLQISFYDN